MILNFSYCNYTIHFYQQLKIFIILLIFIAQFYCDTFKCDNYDIERPEMLVYSFEKDKI